MSGNYRLFVVRGLLFGDHGGLSTRSINIVNAPVILVGDNGDRFWGMVRQVVMANAGFKEHWSYRDLLAVKHTPSCITVVAQESSRMLWQNSQSMAMFGEGRRGNGAL